MNEEWKSRLGNDPWKNAIRHECDRIEALLGGRKLAAVGIAATTSPTGGPKKIQFQKSLEYESFRIDHGTDAPFGQSYAVFQTGRFFLIGPTRRAVSTIDKRWLSKNERSCRIKHVHVVILCWHEDHWSGLTKLADILKKKKIGMTIWSSYWIWEEVSLRLSTNDQFKPVAPKFQKAELFRDDEWLKNRADYSGIKVAAFEKQKSWELTCGVSVSLSYSLSSLPFLRVEFCCNNFKIVIDPGLLFLLPRRASSANGQALKAMDGGLPGRLTEMHDLVDQSQCLLKQIPGSNMRVRRHEERLEHWQSGLLYTSLLGFHQPVDLLEPGQIEPFTKHPDWNQSVSGNPATNEPAPPAGKATAVLADTVLVLLCGGLMDKVNRNLIDPSYELDIDTRNGKQRAFQKMSILEWRLHQISEWFRASTKSKAHSPLPVVLLTTPESGSVVRRLVKNVNPKLREWLDLLPACAQLMADYKRDGSRIGPRFEEDDGGWSLRPRGHMDAVRLLQERTELWRGRKVCLILAFNNLGDVFDMKTKKTLSRIREILNRRNGFGVELFRYKQEPNDTDQRWDQLSYCPNPNSPILIKNSYLSKEEEAPDRDKRFYSSLTCYVRLSVLARISEKGLRGIGFVIDERRERVVPRQDIDLITHGDWFSAKGFQESQDEANSLYDYDRYLGVRTQDHVRHMDFTDKFKRIGSLGRHYSIPSSPGLKNVPILEMIPCPQRYPWGGYEIATLKGEPPEMIAETWEVSGYRNAQSSVALDDKQALLLQNALEKAKLPECKVLLKYLDCHGPLSVQVHPTHRTAKKLVEQGFSLRDEHGKEESFFVIDTAPGRTFNLFFGFRKERLSDLANAIRPKILQYAYDLTMDFENSRRALAEAMRTILESFYLPKVMSFLRKLSTSTEPLLIEADIERFGGIVSNMLQNQFTERVAKAICFHSEGDNAQGPSPSELLGKEFLLGGVALIGLIEILRDSFHKQLQEANPPRGLLEAARKLFGEELQKGGDESKLDAHPLLSLFCRVKVEKNSWVRIPPGIIHGWQGGGNRLVEIGYSSDNTLRVLDFGREPGRSREMHYYQAMCALNPFSFFDTKSLQRLLLPAWPGSDGFAPCHDLLNYRLYHGEGKPETLLLRDSPIYVMNPDGELTLTVTHLDHSPIRRTIGRMRTVLIHSRDRGTLELNPQQEDNRVLCFLERKAESPLLCLCPGGTDWEFALWQDQQLPSVQRVATPKRRVPLKEFLETSALGTLRNRCPKSRIALSWPGFIRRANNGSEPELLFSTALDNLTADEAKRQISAFAPEHDGESQVLSDFHAAILGEVRHPLGRLSLHEPGMLINVGAGLCLSFYHPDFHRSFRLDDLFHDNWLTVCSGIGRWLFVDSYSSEMSEGDGRLETLVFCKQPKDIQHDQIRASKWFSAAGIVTQVEHGNAAVTWEQILETERQSGQSLAAKLLNQNATTAGVSIDETVFNFGENFAMVVDFARRMMRGEFGFPEGLTTRLNGAELASLAEDCPRNIVLTGLVGQCFGRRPRKGGKPFEDMLTLGLQTKLGTDHHVWRSDIGSVAERETEGFLFFLDYKKREALNRGTS